MNTIATCIFIGLIMFVIFSPVFAHLIFMDEEDFLEDEEEDEYLEEELLHIDERA